MAASPWTRWLTGSGRVPVIVALAAATLTLGWAATGVRLDLGNESMNATTPSLERHYAEFKATFGGDEVIVVSLSLDDLLQPEGLRLLSRLTERIETMDGVRRVLSLTNVVEVVAGPFGAEEQPLLPPTDSPTLTREVAVAALDRNPHLTALLISRDRRTAGVAVEVEERPGDDEYRTRLVESLRALKREIGAPGVEVHLTGITAQKSDSSALVQRDRRVLLPVSVLVLTVALAIATRRVSGVVLPLSVTLAALAWTLGLFAVAGYRVNIITSLLPPVIMVLSITTSLHIYQEWAALGTEVADRRTLAARVVETMARPVGLTALTTAMGLGSLGVSEVPAVRQFGLFGALGVLIALLLNFTLMPAALSMLHPPPPRHAHAGSRLRPWLSAAGALSVRRPGLVLLIAGGVTAVAIVGIGQIRNNTDLVRFLDPDAELVRDTMFIDEHLVGANSLELVVERVDARPLDRPEDMLRLEALMEEVEGLTAVTSTLGIPRLVAQVYRAERDLPRAVLPRGEDDLLACLDLLEAAERREDIGRLITADFRRARIGIRLHAIGSREGLELLERIRSAARRTLGDDYRVTPTGEFYRVIVDSTRLVASQLRSFALAVGTVFLVIGVAFRDPRLLLAALIPNLLPIVWASGLMGWVGIDLSVATAMVASIMLGVAVDGTIHYLERFRRAHRGDDGAAVREATLRTGRVLAMASLVLAVGFWVGALGSFRPTVYFSLLTGGTILFALICDLLVLPACLIWIRPRSRATA